MQVPLFCLLALFAVANALAIDIVNTNINIPAGVYSYDNDNGYIVPSMKCDRRCLPPQHVYEVALLHDKRGCTKQATFNPELMDNISQHRPGQRVTGTVEKANYFHGPRCEVEYTDECAPSYHYYAVFSKGCILFANGTLESYNTYTTRDLASAIEILVSI
jgi:hypothetical protein